MPKAESTFAVEFDGGHNQNFTFPPLGKIRGRFDLHRIPEPNAGKLNATWPTPIPGQIVEFDPTTGEGHVIEPLWEEKFAAIR